MSPCLITVLNVLPHCSGVYPKLVLYREPLKMCPPVWVSRQNHPKRVIFRSFERLQPVTEGTTADRSDAPKGW